MGAINMLKALRYVGVTLAGSIICLLVIVLCCCRPRHPNNTRDFAQLFRLVLPLLGVRYQQSNQAPVQGTPAIYVANHQSNFDMFFCAAVLPQRATLIGKNSLKYIPVFGLTYWLSGNIFLDRNNHSKAWKTIRKVAEQVREKRLSIFIFPEGTRSGKAGLLPFKRGAFALAIEAQVPIVPVCTSSTYKNIDLNRWQAGEVRAEYLPPISTEGMTRADARRLAEQCRQQMAECIDRLDQQIIERR